MNNWLITKRRAFAALITSGIALFLLGGIVIVGWHTHNNSLVQLSSHFAPMQYNTALGFLLCGMALLFSLLKKKKTSDALSIMTGAIALLTLFEYIFDVDLSIDEFFIEHEVTIATSHPGRMAPNTALCFLLGAIAMIIPPDNLVKIKGKAFISGVVTSLGLAALVGYAINIESIYGWGNLTHMALHTSFGFILMGISLTYYYIVMANEMAQKLKYQFDDWWNGFALILLLFIFYLDISIPRGVATGILYVLVVAIAWFIKSNKKKSFWLAFISSFCIIVGYFSSPHGSSAGWMVIANRLLSLLTIWIVAALIFRVKKYEEELIDANNDLEMRVKKRTRKLKESEGRFRAVFENSSVGIALINEKGIPDTFNDAFMRLLGYPKETLKNLSFAEFTHTNYIEKDLGLYRELLEGKRDSYSIEKKYIKYDGTEIWADLFVSSVKNADGTHKYALGLVLDINEKKIAREKLRNINADLERMVEDRTNKLKESNKELESFSYSVSHDLRAPLRAVNSFAKILEEDYIDKLDEEGKDALNTIQINARYMGQLIDDLLQFSRLGRQKVSKGTINMNDLTKEVLDLLGQTIDLNNYEVAIKDLPDAKGERDLVKQVMINLISNALKYSSKAGKPKIIVGSEKINNKTTYFVKDNGVGFNMDYADKLFGVFQRLHSQSEFEGTGVGLAIAHRIIERHSGKIWAEAEEGKGAAFFFQLK